MYDAALPTNALVKGIINGFIWNWPGTNKTTNSLELMAIRKAMNLLSPPNDERDTLNWCNSPDGNFNLSHTWDHFHSGHPSVPWYKPVWKSGGRPRYSFILWLAIQEKLSTHDCIYEFTAGPLICVLCNRAIENHNHLFFLMYLHISLVAGHPK